MRVCDAEEGDGFGNVYEVEDAEANEDSAVDTGDEFEVRHGGECHGGLHGVLDSVSSREVSDNDADFGNCV